MNWTERRRLVAVLVGAVGYVVLAGVVAVGNIVGLELSQVPTAAVALFGLGSLLLLATGALAVSAMVRHPRSVAAAAPEEKESEGRGSATYRTGAHHHGP